MTTATETTNAVKTERKARKPRVKPSRWLTILELPTADLNDYGAFRVVEGKKDEVYIFRGIEADFGIGYEIEKLTMDLNDGNEVYHVNLAGRESSCTCKGNTYAGHCRHVEALAKLHERGILTARQKQKYASCNRCQRVSDSPLCEACHDEAAYHTACNEAAEMEAAGIDPWADPMADDVFEPSAEERFEPVAERQFPASYLDEAC